MSYHKQIEVKLKMIIIKPFYYLNYHLKNYIKKEIITDRIKLRLSFNIPSSKTEAFNTFENNNFIMPRPNINNEKDSIKLNEIHETGVNGFFRVLSSNLNNQNNLADNKASTLISINSILLTLIISTLVKQANYFNNFEIPIFLLMGTTLAATILAILVTRPTLKKAEITQEFIDEKKTTFLFFGNFSSLSLQDFEDTMLHIIKNEDYLYRSILADFYGQGKILERKYRLLSHAYNIFLYGIIVSVILFSIFSLV